MKRRRSLLLSSILVALALVAAPPLSSWQASRCRSSILVALALVAAPPLAAQSAQLLSPDQLGSAVITADFPDDEQAVLDYPYVVKTADNTLTFTNGSPIVKNEWTRLNQFDPDTGTGLVLANFAPGTKLLLANSTSQFTVTFAAGVKKVGFFANVAPLGPEEFRFEVFNGARSLGSYTVHGISSQSYAQNPAPFIGVIAQGNEVITRLTLNVTLPPPDALEIGFAISTVRYRSVHPVSARPGKKRRKRTLPRPLPHWR